MDNLIANLVFIVWDDILGKVVKVFVSETDALEYIAFHPKLKLSYFPFAIE